MNSIEVDIKKIKTLFNPLADKYTPVIEEVEIIQMIEQGTVFDFLGDDKNPRSQFMAQVAYYLTNPLTWEDKAQPVIINIGYPEKAETASVQNEAWLVASIMQAQKENRKSIATLFTGSELAIQAFFKIKTPIDLVAHNEAIESLNQAEKKNDLLAHFEWQDMETVVANPWTDREYFLNQMQEQGITLNMINQSPAHFWEDKEFLKLLNHYGSKKAICMLPPYVLMNHEVIETLLQSPDIFGYVWDNYYQKLFREDFEYIAEELNRDNYVSNVDKESERYDWRVTEQQKDMLVEFLLQDKNLLQMAQNVEHGDILLTLGQLPETTSDHVCARIVEMEYQRQKYLSESLYSVLPRRYFENDENSIKTIKACHYNRSIHKKYNFIWENWIKDENKLIEYLPELKGKNFDFYEDLPKNWAKNENVILALLSYNADIYKNLPEKQQLSLPVIQKYIQEGGSAHLSKEALILLDQNEDHKSIKNLIRNSDSILNNYNTATPNKWRRNIDYLVEAPAALYGMKKTKEVINKLSEPQIAIKLVANCQQNYSWLNPEAKANIEIVKTYVIFEQTRAYDWEQIPKSVFMSEKNCLDLLSLKEEACEFVPQGMWGKPSFLLEVLSRMDKHHHLYKEDMLKYLPEQIGHFFDIHKTEKGNYRASVEQYLNRWQMAEKISNSLTIHDDNEEEEAPATKMKI
jgi:hypothetical protein